MPTAVFIVGMMLGGAFGALLYHWWIMSGEEDDS